MYVQDYDEKYPYYYMGTTTDTSIHSYPHIWWDHLVQPYIKNLQVYRCPSSKEDIASGCDYGWNHNVFNVSTGKKLGTIAAPAQLMFMADKGSGGGPYVLSGGYYMCADRHNGGGNVGFADGHVKWWMMQQGVIPGQPPNAGYDVYPHNVFPAGANRTTPDGPGEICYEP